MSTATGVIIWHTPSSVLPNIAQRVIWIGPNGGAQEEGVYVGNRQWAPEGKPLRVNWNPSFWRPL